MKLLTHKASIVAEKKYPGLLDVKFEHEIKSTKAAFVWNGPKIPADAWQEMLAFFKWTYDTYHSESQVRLYVNVRAATWDIWAYPQEARTGMTAKELGDHAQFKEQREMYPDSEGWIYFGTVHHHCNCSAFQSGVDEHNEKNQDGLHITIGSMASDKHDLHCRFYLNGACFDPDMSLFWDVGEYASTQLPKELHNSIARYQMGIPGKDVKFPEIWKANVIEVKYTTGYMGQAGTMYGTGAIGNANQSEFGHLQNHQGLSVWQRAKNCVNTVIKEALESNFTIQELEDMLDYIREDELYNVIATNLSYFKVDFDDLVREWPTETEAAMMAAKVLGEMQGDNDNTPGDDDDAPKKVKVTVTSEQAKEAPKSEGKPQPATGVDRGIYEGLGEMGYE